MPRTPAELAVDAIIEDLSDRRGLRQEWEQIDRDIRKEIRAEWIKLVEKWVPRGDETSP